MKNARENITDGKKREKRSINDPLFIREMRFVRKSRKPAADRGAHNAALCRHGENSGVGFGERIWYRLNP